MPENNSLSKVYELIEDLFLDSSRNETVKSLVTTIMKALSGEVASNTFNIKKIDPTSADYAASFELQDHTGARCGDVINIFKDQHLKSVNYNPETKDLEFVFILKDGSESPVNVPLDDLFVPYVQGSGILFTKQGDGSIQISLDPSVLSGYLTKEEANGLYQPKGNYQPAGNYAPAASEEDPYVHRSELPKMPDLSPYLTKASAEKTYQPKGNYLTQVPEEYIPVKEVEDKKVWALPEETQIMGTIAGALYALLSLRIYNKGQEDEVSQAEVGTTSYHLNLNTKDNITYDTPEGKKVIANLDDLKDNLKIVERDGKKVVTLPESVQLMGTIGEAIYALAAIQKYAQEEGADLIQVEVGTTSFHLNLNTADNITYDTPDGKKTLATDEVATSEKKGLLSSEDKAKLDKVDLDTFIIDLSNSDEAKQIHLALVEKYKDITEAQPVQNVYVKNQNKVGLLGKTNLIPITGVAIKSGAPHFFCDLTVQFQFGELPADSCFGNLEFYFSEDGTASYQVSNTLINSGGNVLNYQDGGLVAKIALKYVSGQRGKVQLTGIGDKVISELDADLYSIPWRGEFPIRTPMNKVFEESEILEWFHVESVSELKTVVNTRNLYMKYGILLTGKPMYYNMPIQYAAFESNTQIKLIWVGLDTSNDNVSKYTILINLDGTIIEGNSNVQVTLKTIETTE